MVVITRHNIKSALLLLLKLQNVHMSENEYEGDGHTKQHPPLFKSSHPMWRSPQLGEFLHSLDDLYREDWVSPVPLTTILFAFHGYCDTRPLELTCGLSSCARARPLRSILERNAEDARKLHQRLTPLDLPQLLRRHYVFAT